MTKIITDPIHYKNIADAIRAKTGETKSYYPSEMASKIQKIGEYEPFIPDNYIFMEGKGFNMKYVDADKIGHSYQRSPWGVDSLATNYFCSTATGSVNANAVLLFKEPFDKRQYSKVKIEAEIKYGKNGYYNYAFLGLRKHSLVDSSLSMYADFTKKVALTNCSHSTNYTGTSPWYNLPRTVVEIDTTDFPEDYFNIAFHH